MDGTMAYVSLLNLNGELYVVARQTLNGHINELILNQAQFSAFMFLIKGIETAFCKNKMSATVASTSSVNSDQMTML